MQDIVVSVITAISPFGVALLLLTAMIIPFIPSEFTAGSAGLAVVESGGSVIVLVLCAVAGVLIGNIGLYVIGSKLKRRRIKKWVGSAGKYVGYSVSDVKKAEKYYRDHGSIVTFIGQLLPGIRFAVGLAAGLSEVNFKKYCVFVFLSGAIWTSLFISIGYFFGPSLEGLLEYYEGFGNVLAVIVVGFIAYRIVKVRYYS